VSTPEGWTTGAGAGVAGASLPPANTANVNTIVATIATINAA
jgi:hypothetical protein